MDVDDQVQLQRAPTHEQEVPRRPRRRPGENRERLLEAGIAEFGARGYRGSSTSAIAAAAGVPQPHVYASFPTKRDLFIACARLVFAELAEANGDGGVVGSDARGSDARADESVAGRSAAFLVQAIASVNDGELSDELLPAIRHLRAQLSEDAFSLVVTIGVNRLI